MYRIRDFPWAKNLMMIFMAFFISLIAAAFDSTTITNALATAQMKSSDLAYEMLRWYEHTKNMIQVFSVSSWAMFIINFISDMAYCEWFDFMK